jgi:hypothetical protein
VLSIIFFLRLPPGKKDLESVICHGDVAVTAES